MLRKDDVLTYFKSSSGSSRIDLLCRILRFCSPLELRFVAAVLEDMCRKDHHELQSIEHHVNTTTLFADSSTISLHEKPTRRRLLISLALLRSDNHLMAHRLYEQIMQCLCPNGGLKDNFELYEEGLLLLLMAANHPALLFDERQRLWRRIEQLTRDSEVTLTERSQGDRADATEPIVLRKIDVKDVQPRAGSRSYEYHMEVTWTDGSANYVYRTHQELFEFQNRLLDMFPNEGGRKNRIIPFLPGKRYLSLRSKELADKRLPEIADYARKLVQLPAKISHSQIVLDFFSDEERKRLSYHRNVLSEALTDMTVANSNPPVDRNSSSRQETSRQGVQAAGSESPRGRKLNPTFSAASHHSTPSASPPAARVSSLRAVPSNPIEDTPSTFTARSAFVPVPHMPPYPLVRPPNPAHWMFNFQQPGFPIRQPHVPFMHHHFPQGPQCNFKTNNPAPKIHPLLNLSSSVGMGKPPTLPARPQFQPHMGSPQKDKHYDDSGVLNRVHAVPRKLKTETRHGDQSLSSSLPCSPSPSPGQPRVGGLQSTPSTSHATRTPSPMGRQRHSSSTSSSPGLVQDLCVITSLFDWLKVLRLHKYHHLFEKMTYEEMLALTEDDLEKMKLTDGPRRKFMRQLEYLKSQGFKGFDAVHLPFRTSTSEWSLDSDSVIQHGVSGTVETDFNDMRSGGESGQPSPTGTPGPYHNQVPMPEELENEEPCFVPECSTGGLQVEEAATFVLQVHPQTKGNLVSFAAPVMIDSLPLGNNGLPIGRSSVYSDVPYGPQFVSGGEVVPGSGYGHVFHVDGVIGGYAPRAQESCYKCGQQGHCGPNCTSREGCVSDLRKFTLRLNGPVNADVPSTDSVDP